MKAEVMEFLKDLGNNNNRPWFQENKGRFEAAKAEAHSLFREIELGLKELDEFHDLKFYRIYRDIRFSKDKTPYKNHFSAIFQRKQPENRGSFYVHLQPGSSFIGGGFWGPDKEDLLRIRKAIDIEDDLEEILTDPALKKSFRKLKGDKLKRVPKDFDKEHPRGNLLKYKQFLLTKRYSDKDVVRKGFVQKVLQDYQTLQPFFNYMTEVLTTDENGVSLY